jgi:hypothetical protein
MVYDIDTQIKFRILLNLKFINEILFKILFYFCIFLVMNAQ